MGQNNKLEKEIDFLIQEFRGYFFALIAISSGESSLIYAVLCGDKPIYVLILAILGFLIFLALLLKVKNIKFEVYRKLKKLGDVQCK